MKTLPILFSYDDVKNIYPNINSFYSFLNYNLKRGTIKKIKKGLYALIDISKNDIYASKFEIASKLFLDSYFSYHEALEYYGLATQVFTSSFTYLTHVRVSPLEFNNITYYSKVSKCNLEIIDTIKENGIRVVSLERALIDSIDNLSLGGGIEEIELALDSSPKLNIEKILTLLKFYNKASLYQKVGYLFEKYFKDEIDESFFTFCLNKISNKKIYLSSIHKNTKLISKWNILIKDKGEELIDELF